MSTYPPKLAFNLERDLRVLAAMASSLTPYLYEDELYGYLAGNLPKLTLGGLLLRLHRLTCLEDMLSAEQQTLLHDARINLEAERADWAVHFEGKIKHELRARLEALELFVRECDTNAGGADACRPRTVEAFTLEAGTSRHLTRLPPRLQQCVSHEAAPSAPDCLAARG